MKREELLREAARMIADDEPTADIVALVGKACADTFPVTGRCEDSDCDKLVCVAYRGVIALTQPRPRRKGAGDADTQEA